MKDNTVIVIDNANYNADYAEPVPFKARVFYDLGYMIVVLSIVTGKEYHLYYHQVLELLPIEDIRKLIDLSKYGE